MNSAGSVKQLNSDFYRRVILFNLTDLSSVYVYVFGMLMPHCRCPGPRYKSGLPSSIIAMKEFRFGSSQSEKEKESRSEKALEMSLYTHA
ncbi:hypothetical protein STEG23_016077 [Scotinomys teguina]